MECRVNLIPQTATYRLYGYRNVFAQSNKKNEKIAINRTQKDTPQTDSHRKKKAFSEQKIQPKKDK